MKSVQLMIFPTPTTDASPKNELYTENNPNSNAIKSILTILCINYNQPALEKYPPAPWGHQAGKHMVMP